MRKKTEWQKGSALLYAVLLISALVVLSQAVFTYLFFAVKARRLQYFSEVNYWLAWGGIESALQRIHRYSPGKNFQNNPAWCRWPNREDNTIDNPYFGKLVFGSGEDWKEERGVILPSPSDYAIGLSITNFRQLSSQDSVSFQLGEDESELFDLSQFKGTIKLDFERDPAQKEKNLLWIRVETEEGEIKEAVFQFKEGEVVVKKDEAGNGFPFSLSWHCQGQNCTASFFVNSGVRFFKVKMFKGKKTSISFSPSSRSKLGLPYTVIHAQGWHGGDHLDLYTKFPNVLRSIPDILDYSLYQSSALHL